MINRNSGFRKQTLFFAVLLATLVAIINDANVFAAGKAPASSDTTGNANSSSVCGASSTLSAPAPTRGILLKAVASQPFPLPNGGTADLSYEMTALLNTVVTNTKLFMPLDSSSATIQQELEDQCKTHLELHAAVSAIEIDLYDLGIIVGYTPSGSHSILTQVTGQAKVHFGTLAMDFSIWKCNGTQCFSVVASTAHQSLVTATENLTLDFGIIAGGPSFMQSPDFNQAIRSVMTDGVNQLLQSQRLVELDWRATVQDFSASTSGTNGSGTGGTLTFDAGQQSRIGANQTFIVYAVTSAQGGCPVYHAIASIHTVRADPISSAAVVDQVLDSTRTIRPGDIVIASSP